MNSEIAKLVLAALLAAPLVSSAQNLFPQNDRQAGLTLLPGPKLLSPANATGEVAPGQTWTLSKTGISISNSTSPGKLTLGQAPLFTFLSANPGAVLRYSGTTTLAVSGGTLSLSTSNSSSKEKEKLGRRPKPAATPADPSSLRFDEKLHPVDVSPLEKTLLIRTGAKPEQL